VAAPLAPLEPCVNVNVHNHPEQGAWSRSADQVGDRAKSATLLCAIADEGTVVGGTVNCPVDGARSVGMVSIVRLCRRSARVPAIVNHRQEVRPMNAVSIVGAPLQSTIARLT
jgi:hypothetical protein